ncbi:MAG: DUF4340 domain-containing protein [Pseudomonadota bacterium]
MRPKKLWIILVITILALLAIGVWDHYKTESSKESSAEKKVVEFKPEDITGIEIKNPVTTDVPAFVSLKKNEGSWALVSPENGAADAAVVDTMIKLLADFTYTKVAGVGEEAFAGYGVSEDAARKVSLTKANGEVIHFWFGGKSPVGYSVYVRQSLKPNEVLVANQHLLSATSKTIVDLRSKTILSMDPANVSSIEFNAMKLSRTSSGWTIKNSTGDFTADASAVDSWLADLLAIKAAGFTNPSPTDKGLPKLIFANSKGEVLFSGAGGEVAGKLRIIHTEKGLGYDIDSASKQVLEKPLADFRAKKVLDLPIAELNAFKVNGHSFKKTGEKWEEGANGSVKPTGVDAAAFVMDLDFARATGFEKNDKKSSKKPEWTIDLETSKGEKRKLFVFESKSTENVNVGTEVQPDLMVVPRKVFEKLASAK